MQTRTLTNILIVDDDVFTRKVLLDAIRPLGHSLFEAEDGHQALNTLAMQSIDIVIADVYMPGMSGVDLLKQIRAINPNIPVIMVTGSSVLEVAIESLNAGAFHYVVKPIDDQQVAEVIDRAVQKVEENQLQRRIFDHYQELERYFAEGHHTEPETTSDTLVKDLINSLLHELGNVTAAIKLNLFDMQERNLSPKTIKRQLSDLESSANTIMTILERLRQYPQRGLQLEPTDLRNVVQSAVDIARQRFADVSFIVETAPEPLMINGAAFELSRAFMNVLENAAEAIGRVNKRKIPGCVTISVEPRGTQIAVTFVDNGPGFQNEALDKLFSPGYTTKISSGFVRGLGLGLFIIRATVQLHSGAIWLRDNPEGGAVVEIQLPQLNA
jgi:signal transduction histidine kinase